MKLTTHRNIVYISSSSLWTGGMISGNLECAWQLFSFPQVSHNEFVGTDNMLISKFIIQEQRIAYRPRTAMVILMMVIISYALLLPAYSLTQLQKKGMYRHGIWEWSLQNCPGALRNTGYWFGLINVGKFKNAEEIIQNENGRDFLEGWKYMAVNAEKFGLERTCDYAFREWPAVLWREG